MFALNYPACFRVGLLQTKRIIIWQQNFQNQRKAKTEALVLDHKEDRYPVQQVATDGKVTKKEVKDAVKEINPDLNSLGSRDSILSAG